MELEKREEGTAESAASTTTTAPILAAWQNYPNPCTFRGHTIEILEALNDCGNLTTKEIAGITGMTVNDVGHRCREGKKRGIFAKIDRWKWMITDYGEFVLKININKSTTNRTHINNQSTTNQQPTLDSEKKQRQLNLSIFDQNEDLSELQRVVVVAMAKHYEKTGRPYYMVHDFHQFRDEVGLDVKYSYTDVQDVVISLEVAGFIYHFTKGDIIKIGLLKSTIEKLQNA